MTGLFGSSGIRGVVNHGLTIELASSIGSAVGTFVRQGKVLVARDSRVSGPLLEQAIVSGLLSIGTDAIRLGIMPTPALGFLTRKLKANAGIMITASHNPPEYNGIKIFDSEGIAFNEKKQYQIEQTITGRRFHRAKWNNLGKQISQHEGNAYLDMLTDATELHEKLHLIVDPGCGATSDFAPKTFVTLGCRVKAINAQPDGFFPARSSEPNEQSLQTLSQIVKASNVDAGLAYDGDGDRVAFIDEHGDFIDFDRALAAYARHVISINPGGIVVTNVEASMCVEKAIEDFDGRVVRTRVGDIYISEAMKKHRAEFGGEPCGAWIHPQFHYCPDGILSSVMMLEALEKAGKPMTQFIDQIRAYPMLRRNLTCPNETKQLVIKDFEAMSPDHFRGSLDISLIDGVRVTLENGWFLVRASGTEPFVRLTVEGESLKAAEKIMQNVSDFAKNIIKERNK